MRKKPNQRMRAGSSNRDRVRSRVWKQVETSVRSAANPPIPRTVNAPIHDLLERTTTSSSLASRNKSQIARNGNAAVRVSALRQKVRREGWVIG